MNKARLISFILLHLLLAHSIESVAQKRYIYKSKQRNQPVVEQQINHRNLDVPSTVKKDIYRIDFLLPLHLENLPDKPQRLSSINPESMIGVHFYEGILMAMDSLERSGKMYYDIYIHDIGKIPFDDIVNDGKLENTDLIIGAVQSAELPIIAQYAKDRQINFLSVLSPATAGITENPFFIITQPTLETHLKHIINYAETTKASHRPILLYSDAAGDDLAFTAFKSLVKRRHQELKIENDQLNINALTKILSKTQTNLIYTTFLSPATATKIIQQLNTLHQDYKIEIIGLPSWKGAPILTDSSLNSNITIFIPYGHQYDVEVDKRLNIRQLYAKNGRGLPSELVFKGYETTLLATELLYNWGTYFNSHFKEQLASFSTEFQFQEQYSEQRFPLYYENVKSYIYRYHHGTLNVIKE